MAETACPFCGVTSPEELAIQWHIEENHNDESTLVSQDAVLAQSPSSRDIEPPEHSTMPGDEWIKCTRPGCGEYVLKADIDEHLDVHTALALSEGQEASSSEAPHSREQVMKESSREPGRQSSGKLQKPRPGSDHDGTKSTAFTLLDYFSGNSVHGRPKPFRPPQAPGRLGKRELGPHAFEKSMPAEVRRRLINDGEPRVVNKLNRDGQIIRESLVENETTGAVSLLADLCALDKTTQATYLCNPCTKHVRKLQCDGNFCGFWNIQMLLSYLQGTGALRDMRQLPNVLQIQDTIERAWDNGICSYGRVETGGIRGTRKWIGTAEAAAFLTQVGVPVEALSFEDDDEHLAVTALLDYVEAYFMSGLDSAKSHHTSHITQLAPIYFQRLGHSMTIVGLERKTDGSRNLLMFDPSFGTSDAVRRLLAGNTSRAAPETLLKAYRRSDQSLARWEEFEVVVPQATSKSCQVGPAPGPAE